MHTHNTLSQKLHKVYKKTLMYNLRPLKVNYHKKNKYVQGHYNCHKNLLFIYAAISLA